MESSTKKKQLVHVLPHRKQRVLRKRTTSLSCEESPIGANVEADCKPFAFPAPPQQPHRPSSETFSYLDETDTDSQSDSSVYPYHDISSPVSCVHTRLKCQGYQSEGSPVPLHTVPRLLPPIGVFWDIENCQVPKGKSAVAVAQVIRKRFFTGYREAEFLVVCDVKKESNQILQELNDAQVNLIHVASMCKNAADEKLRQSMRRFADIHGSPASIVLISGDINFAADITDLRHRKKINVILLHMENTSENLILCASEHYSFSELMETLPLRGAIKQSSQPVEVVVYNLPPEKDSCSVKSRLRQLSNNCGGRVTALKQTCATIRFTSFDIAGRAQKRMDGEDVFGRKIQVSQPVRVIEKDESPQKSNNRNSSGRKYPMNSGRENISGWADSSVPISSSLYRCVPATFNLFGPGVNQNPCVGNWSVYGSTSTSFNVAQECYTGIYTGFHTPPVEASASNLPFSAFGGQNPSCLLHRNSPAEMVTVPCDFLDKAPRGLRQIRSTQKGLMPLKSEPLEMETNQQATNSVDISHSVRALVKAGHSDAPYQVQSSSSRNSSPFVTFSNLSNNVKQNCNKGCTTGLSRTPTPVLQQYDGDLDEPEHFFHPINSSDLSCVNGSSSNEPVELHVSNLDQTFGAREMKKILLRVFKEHVMVLSLLVLVQQDGSLNALVRLASQQDAQYAIYKLQRHKIGHKRIRISHGSISRPSPQLIRSQVISLLQEVPNHKLPLFKFCELYESRFLSSISISDIYKVKECEVTDGPRGRIVSLLVDARNSPSPQLQVLQEMEILEPPVCPLHGQEVQPNRGWAEQEFLSLPSVNISLKLLAVRVHALLQTHNGSIHLNSLPQCYQAQFEALEEDKEGVALEHLASCIPGIEIFNSPGNIKYLRWVKTVSISSSSSRTDEDFANKTNASLAGKLAVFSRELVDLLKTTPRCQISFEKFIPAYHHHFGRQCRVADYGYTKLIELLESLPHTVQVLGEGNNRMVTLSHRVQLRRFMGDLLRVLRGQVNKQVLLSELPNAFEQVFNRPLVATSYGVCDVMDLLSDLPDASVVVSNVTNDAGDDILIAIPKREQTPEEIERTKQFSAEVVELLRHVPNCSMRFRKFIPAHHIHFGWQCRVADYGFTKLIELFEAVPDVVQITNMDGERWVSLTKTEHLKVLADQIISLLHNAPQCTLNMSNLKSNYRVQFGYSLRPEIFDCSTEEELLALLPDTIKVISSSEGLHVTVRDMKMSVQSVLIEEPNWSMDFNELAHKYKQNFNHVLSLDELKRMNNIEVVELDKKTIVSLGSACVQQQLIQDIEKLVVESGGSLPLSSVESKYLQKYGRPCHPTQFGFSSLGALLQTMRGSVRLRGRGTRRSVVLTDSVPGCVTITSDLATPAAETASNENTVSYPIISTVVTVADVPGDSSSTNEGDSGHDDASSTSAVDIDSSLSTGSKAHSSERNSGSEILSDIGISINGGDPIGHAKPNTPEKEKSSGLLPDVSPIWCAASPPCFTPYKGPWSKRIMPHLNVTDSPAVMLSPTSNLLPAFTTWKKSSNFVMCPLPPLYSYPPFLPGHVASPEPSTLPLPQLGLAAPLLAAQEVSSVNDSSNSSTPNKTKVKRRLAAQFHTPLDLP